MILYYVDAHIHLCEPEYAPNLDEILNKSRQDGVRAVLSCAVDLESSKRTLDVALNWPSFFFTSIGIHPSTVVREKRYDLAQLEKLVIDNRSRVHAVGETGLDGTYTNDRGLVDLCRGAFEESLGIAERNSLPLVVHSRGAVGRVIEILTSSSVKKVLLHWFAGDITQLEGAKDAGYYIGVGPAVTYSKSIRRIVEDTPLELILTETDGPVRFHGPLENIRTTPSLIPLVAKEIGRVKSTEPEDVSHQIWRNFCDFLDIRSES